MWYMGYLPGTVPDGEPATVEEARAAALAAGYEKPEEMMTTYEYYYTEPERKYHMNWGWDGNLNDYYNISFTLLLNGQVVSFPSNRRILYNIHNNTD